jgi:hypothetical protein
VNFYDILQDGFHTPLTANQIADLFNAGRVGRNTPCKRAEKKDWRTVDELFPLLKYDSSRRFVYQSGDARPRFGGRRHFAIAACFAGVVGMALILHFALRDSGNTGRLNPPIETVKVDPQPPQRIWTNTQQTVVPATQNSASVVAEVPAHLVDDQSAVRLTEAKRIEEQARRDQAIAEQDRAAKQQILLEQEKAAGRDQHIMLDHWQTVNVGGYSVSVKIHDNDTISFDVWINGEHYREVKKQKGITGSRADETFIYSNGRAALYYVWEISGRIDHCLLRVRDA